LVVTSSFHSKSSYLSRRAHQAHQSLRELAEHEEAREDLAVAGEHHEDEAHPVEGEALATAVVGAAHEDLAAVGEAAVASHAAVVASHEAEEVVEEGEAALAEVAEVTECKSPFLLYHGHITAFWGLGKVYAVYFCGQFPFSNF
jgi:hypothetical protein